jgi:3-oxoacyl-[acyl-carrier-protein] synthase-3
MATRIYSVIVGTGSYIPERIVPNTAFLQNEFYKTYDEPFDRSKNEEIIEKFEAISEIGERRYVDDDLLTSDIATRAAQAALNSSGIEGESLDYIVVAHNFGDIPAKNPRSDLVPSLAARVKQRLEIDNPRCVAYDLPFGCAGWLQGVIQADYYMRAGDAKRAMIIGAETLSRVSDPSDRDGMLYADGAGCTILEARTSDEPVGLLAHATRSDALKHASLMWMGESFKGGYGDGASFLKMRGRRLYEYAVTVVPDLVHETLHRVGLRERDVDKILMHQANAKMNGAILKRLLKLGELDAAPAGIMPMTISFLGNSSVATVPTLLDLIVTGKLDGQTLESGDLVVFAAVGAGMNSNSAVYRWP